MGGFSMDPKLLEELRQKYIKNPTEDMTAKLVEKPSKDSFESSIYSKDELRDFLWPLLEIHLSWQSCLQVFYGLRRSEIVGLKWRAIDFVRKTITVQHVVTQAVVDGEYKLVKKNRTKTKASNRSLPLVPQFEKDCIFKNVCLLAI